tara:strand:+ start:410 stop:1009 length:600 start_codon:yes stop_codon:yes gene_type:complete
MCEPVSLAAITGMSASAASATALAIQGVTAVAGVGSAIQGAKNQNAAAQANAQSAQDAYLLKSKQSALRLRQEQVQASQARQDADLKTLKAQGSAMASAGGAGVQGINVDQLLKDFEASEGLMSSRIEQRLGGLQQQAEMDALGFQTEAQSRINSMQPQGFTETLFNVLTPIAGFGVDMADYQGKKASLAPPKASTDNG